LPAARAGLRRAGESLPAGHDRCAEGRQVNIRRISIAILAIVSIGLLAACGSDSGGGSSADDAKSAAKSIAESAVSGDWGAVYDKLYPGQQALVSRDAFVACRSALTPPAYQVSATEANQTAAVAPSVVDENAWVVTLNYQLEGYETLATQLNMHTNDGKMFWYLSDTSINEFNAGRCDISPQLASQFAVDLANKEIAGDWGGVYDVLHPNQQAVVPRDLFIECRTGDTVHATSATVQGVTLEMISVPEVPDSDSYAVTMELTMQDGSKQTQTIHVYEIDHATKQFAWVLGALSIAAFQSGQCD
jgi:hypothetical protein